MIIKISITILICIGLVLWIKVTFDKLKATEEKIKIAMNQIGQHIASNYEALLSLFEYFKDSDIKESLGIIEEISHKRKEITGNSSGEELKIQKEFIEKLNVTIKNITLSHLYIKKEDAYILLSNRNDICYYMIQSNILLYNNEVKVQKDMLENRSTFLLAYFFISNSYPMIK